MPELPTFSTTRLILKPRTLDDLSACLAMDRDAEVTKFIPGPWTDADRHEAFVRERIEADFGEGLGYWSVFQKRHPDRFLGWILLIPRGGAGSEIEVGWRFIREVWGKGYATEAARPVLDYAINTLGLERVVAVIDPNNFGSIHVAAKIGMFDEGLQRHENGFDRVFAAHGRSLRPSPR